MLFYYNNSKAIALDKGRINQQIRIENLARKLETFSITSTQLSKFIQTNINNKILNSNEIEEKLREYIKAAPSETIYGVGIWYEPFSFSNKKRFFGPYIHRVEQSDVKITYEWEDPEYNYHQQDWYKSGIMSQGDGVFVKPYFDKGIVYVTLAKAFFGKNNKIAGVISVDMILPQLQDIINSVNVSPDEQIYITTDDNFLLAHPLEKIINFKETKKTTLIDYTIDDINLLSKIDKTNWGKQLFKIPALNWNVVIESNPLVSLQEIKILKLILIIADITIWIIILILFFIYRKYNVQEIKFNEISEKNRLQLMHSSKMAALGEMAAGMAHEINNPLTIIYAQVDRVVRNLNSNDHDVELIKKDLMKIKNTAKRISRIILSLKTFSRSAEKDDFSNEEIATILNDAKELCDDKIKSQSINLQINIPNNFNLDCRPSQIVQVLVNLLGNSWVQVFF